MLSLPSQFSNFFSHNKIQNKDTLKIVMARHCQAIVMAGSLSGPVHHNRWAYISGLIGPTVGPMSYTQVSVVVATGHSIFNYSW